MSHTLRFVRASVVLAALAVAVPAQGQGYGTWVFTPYIGAYVPTADLTKFTSTDGGEALIGKVKHDAGVALGGNLSYWFAERMGVEFGGAYAWSHADVSSNLESFNDHSYVLMGTAKMIFALLPPAGDVQLRFGVGPAIINRGGTAYKDDEGEFRGLTNVGGAASLCTRIPLTSRLSLRLRAEDYIYQSRLKFRDATDPGFDPRFDRKLQNDLVLSAGLQIGFTR